MPSTTCFTQSKTLMPGARPGMTTLDPNADPFDFPLKLNTGMHLYLLAHGFAQRLDVGRAGAAEIDQEVAVQLGDLRAADRQPAAAGIIHQLPRAVTGRVLEG